MRKIAKIGIALVIIILMLFITGKITVSRVEKNLISLQNSELKTPSLTMVKDGTYSGSYTCFPVSVTVSVTVKDNTITDIAIIEHQNGQGKPAEKITDTVIEKQSITVDAVSGATYSSIVILKAIENALAGSQ